MLVTIHKKGSTQECKNFRTIALIGQVGKVLMMILKRRLQTQVEEHLADEQTGFRKDRGTVQQILALLLLVKKARRKGGEYIVASSIFRKHSITSIKR